MAAGRVQMREDGDVLVVSLCGDWSIEYARDLSESIGQVRSRLAGARRLCLRGHELQRIDTSGAWLIEKLRRAAAAGGREVTVEGFRAADFVLVERIAAGSDDEHCVGVRPRTLRGRVMALGKGSLHAAAHFTATIAFVGRVFATAGRCVARPRRMRGPAIIANMHRAGVNAIPIVALLSFLVAIVLAYQGMAELRRFGAEIFAARLTVSSMLREMGVLITAILVAGRSGSAFASEIGVMKVNEEIDAMKTMGLDPFEVLVLPRIIALVIMVPLLTLVANAAGIIGAAVSVHILLDLPLVAFLANIRDAVTPANFWGGLAKAPVFAFLIGMTATYWGMQVSSSADSVGRSTTTSVVQCIFLVIIANTLFAIVYGRLGV
jgi:phospholipid/cholesterol/gamma-HCH transport system permease protein